MTPALSLPYLLLPLIAASAVATIIAHYLQWRVVFLACKPLTTLLIIALAFSLPAHATPYATLILAGLVFSLAGDIFLMFVPTFFIAGLVSFLVAHCVYAIAFGMTAGTAAWGWPSLAMAACMLLVLLAVAPKAGRLRKPVVIYGLGLFVMQATALGQFAHPLIPASKLVLPGALLFVLSDAILAVNKFTKPFRAAQALILGTYFPAQLLIALSIGLP